MNQSKYIFLLGGMDLEMLEIKSILQKHQYTFFDRNLNWDNAIWAVYLDDLNQNQFQDKIFVGIELNGKEKRPANSIDIDHHNENHENQSALEQVIRLLDVPEEWTRQRQLIAANDQGYIPAMIEMGATPSEISEIRHADRNAQGVEQEDEKNAEISLQNHLFDFGELKVVFALTDRFSTIVDRLFGSTNQLLVYNENSLVFYGNIQALTKTYQDAILNEKAYFGGKIAHGYFGLAKGHWTKIDLLQETSTIVRIILNVLGSEDLAETNKINLMSFDAYLAGIKEEFFSENVVCDEEKIYSHHIFLFPFKWHKSNDVNSFQLSEFDSLIQSNTSEIGNWVQRPFNYSPVANLNDQIVQSGWDRFNEYNYFYPHARKMLYEMEVATMDDPKDAQFIRHFEFELKHKETFYNILLKTKDSSIDASKLTELKANYSLSIGKIVLNVYQFGTAVLSFHLRNLTYTTPEDILKFCTSHTIPIFFFRYP